MCRPFYPSELGSMGSNPGVHSVCSRLSQEIIHGIQAIIFKDLV